MADLDDFEFWHSIMGDSNNKQSDFEGLTHEQVAGRDDESDIDLDLVVNSDRLLAKFESSSEDSGKSAVEDACCCWAQPVKKSKTLRIVRIITVHILYLEICWKWNWNWTF